MTADRAATMLGWSFAQWAEVAAYCKRFSELPEPSMQGASKLYHTWKTNRMDEPGEHRIIEVAHEMDFNYATKLFEAVLKYVNEMGMFSPHPGGRK